MIVHTWFSDSFKKFFRTESRYNLPDFRYRNIKYNKIVASQHESEDHTTKININIASNVFENFDFRMAKIAKEKAKKEAKEKVEKETKAKIKEKEEIETKKRQLTLDNMILVNGKSKLERKAEEKG